MDLEMPPMAPSAPDTLTPSAPPEPLTSSREPSVLPQVEVSLKEDNQDTNQRVGVFITVCAEIYRALIASFLILFVPQLCGDHVCSFSENAQTGTDPLYNAGFYMNVVTFAAFAGLYVTEVRRESKFISYLDVNVAKPCDNLSVTAVLEGLPGGALNIAHEAIDRHARGPRATHRVVRARGPGLRRRFPGRRSPRCCR
jgi:hypothetical protein